MDFIRSKNLIGHTFTPKNDRPFRIVIRNLHHSTPVDEIQTALEARGHVLKGPIINCKYGKEKKAYINFFC